MRTRPPWLVRTLANYLNLVNIGLAQDFRGAISSGLKGTNKITIPRVSTTTCSLHSFRYLNVFVPKTWNNLLYQRILGRLLFSEILKFYLHVHVVLCLLLTPVVIFANLVLFVCLFVCLSTSELLTMFTFIFYIPVSG